MIVSIIRGTVAFQYAAAISDLKLVVMARAHLQQKWRKKNRLVKRQLNVMARQHTHEALEAMATTYALRGKGEAVAFACFVVRALIQRAEYSADAARLLDDLAVAYHDNRDIHST